MTAGKGQAERRLRRVSVDGLRIRTSVRGSGRPLLLMMGIGGNLEMWEPFEQALGDASIQTIAFDAPGTGQSSGWTIPRRMGSIARELEHVLDELGYDQVDLFGVSFGGALAQQFVRQSPQRVRRLILAATLPGVPGLGGVLGSPRALIALATPLRCYSPAYLERIAPVIYGGRIARDPDLFSQQLHAPASIHRRCAGTTRRCSRCRGGRTCAGCRRYAAGRSCSPATTTRSSR
jgi:poly(3-hydroxyoctanoate) depolymerase